MNHGSLETRTRRTWARSVTVAILALACTSGQPGLARSASPGAPPSQGAVVVATGPFGTVAGLRLAPDGDLPGAATLEALDAWGRGAAIRMAADHGSLATWRSTVTQEPSGVGGTVLDLGNGNGIATVHLPMTGLFLLRLDATVSEPTVPGDAGTLGSWVWRIGVPDRDIPAGGDPYPPAPSIMLVAADQAVGLDPGSGCYVGTCGDIGATAPPRTLPTIHTIAGAPLAVHLSDVSGIADWSAEATPIGGTSGQTVQLGHAAVGPPLDKVTFAAPAEGRWVILVHVRFDRDRGSFDGYGRLIVGPPGNEASPARPG